MYDSRSCGVGRGLSYSVNPNGSVTVTIVTGRRAYATLLHWQVVPWVDDRSRWQDSNYSVSNQSGKYVSSWESSSLNQKDTFPFAGSNIGLAAGYYDTFAAWDYSGWQLLGTTNSIADSEGKTFTFVISPVSRRSLLFIREGVWKKSGDEAWVNANKGSNGRSISGNNVRSEWYQSSGAIGFYQPVVMPWNSTAGQYNSSTSSSTALVQETNELDGARYLNSFGSGGYQELASPEPHAFFARGMRCTFAYQKTTVHGLQAYESGWVPRFVPVTITSDKSSLREGEAATVTISHTSNNVLEFPLFLSETFQKAYEYGQLSANNTLLEVNSGTAVQLTSGVIDIAGGTLGALTGTVPALPAGFSPYHDSEGFPRVVNGTISLSGQFTAAQNFEGSAQLSMNTSSFGKGVEVLSGALSSGSMAVGSRVPQVASISASPALVAAGRSASVAIALSSQSSDFTSSDVVVSNGTASSFRGQGAAYGLVVTPPRNSVGNMSVVVSSNSFTGPSGLKNNQSSSLLIPYDTLVPSVQLASNVAALNVGQVANVTLTLSESVSVVADKNANVTSAVSAVGGTFGSWSGNGTKFNALFTPSANFTGDASVSVSPNVLADAAGNTNKSSLLTLSVRTARPTVSITSSLARLGDGQTARITFRLSAESQTFAASDVTVTNGTLTGFTGSGKNYTATFVPSANTVGVATVVVAASAFSDVSGNGNLSGQLAAPIQIDTRPLTASITSSSATLSAGQKQRATITISFNKPPSSFAIPDLTVTNASMATFKRNSQSYSVVLTPSAVGTVTVSIAQGVIEDAYGNKNQAASLTPAITVTT
jgi:hypothetical protein